MLRIITGAVLTVFILSVFFKIGEYYEFQHIGACVQVKV